MAPVSNPAVSHWDFAGFQAVVPFIGVLILAGLAVRLVILVLGLRKLRQLRRASIPVSSGSETAALLKQACQHLSVSADFRLSADVRSPVTFGLGVPTILLPECFPAMDPQLQAAMTCHELLHVRRRDWAHHLAEETIRAACWFHPAVAWLIGRVRLAREQVVDLEVVRFTKARKTYLKALLEFTGGSASAVPVLAPPFLVERQLAERIALMLKEVRMSRTRLTASLIAISCVVVGAVTLAEWAFPLKSASLVSQSKPTDGIAGGISGGMEGGIKGGINGGIKGGINGGIEGGIHGQSADQVFVDRNSIWVDSVKRGSMVLQVRGLGTIVPGDSPGDAGCESDAPRLHDR